MRLLARLAIRYLVISALAFTFYASRTSAQETVVPAGTLIHCTLNEPDFSSATASVGDPVVCQLNTFQEFGRTVFPRGSYLEGHLEADKEPGHFYGKGYLRLVFDRIGLPNTDVPVPGKVIAARGYKVDRQGDILGHGHATRDTAEWLFPPLWPWKVITLPARGPRPALKGEEQLTLRLMEDIALPRVSLGPGWHFFDEDSKRSSENLPPANQPAPAKTLSPSAFQTVASYQTPDRPFSGAQRLTFIALKSGDSYAVSSYRVDNGRLNFILQGGQSGDVPTADVDWLATSKLNTGQGAAPLIQTARAF